MAEKKPGKNLLNFDRQKYLNKDNNSFWSFLFSIINRISEISGMVCAGSIIISAGVLTYEVIMRYLFKSPTIWEIEFSVYLLIMATFVGSAYGLKHGGHINIELMKNILPLYVQVQVSFYASLISFIFCLTLGYTGWIMWWEATSKGWRSDSLWGPPLGISYFFLPFGITLLCFQYLVHLSNLRSKLKQGGIKKLTQNKEAERKNCLH